MVYQDEVPEMITVSVIAERVGARVGRVERILRTKKDQIRPIGRIGMSTRVYGDDAIQKVKDELERIDRGEPGKRGGFRRPTM